MTGATDKDVAEARAHLAKFLPEAGLIFRCNDTLIALCINDARAGNARFETSSTIASEILSRRFGMPPGETTRRAVMMLVEFATASAMSPKESLRKRVLAHLTRILGDGWQEEMPLYSGAINDIIDDVQKLIGECHDDIHIIDNIMNRRFGANSDNQRIAARKIIRDIVTFMTSELTGVPAPRPAPRPAKPVTQCDTGSTHVVSNGWLVSRAKDNAVIAWFENEILMLQFFDALPVTYAKRLKAQHQTTGEKHYHGMMTPTL